MPSEGTLSFGLPRGIRPRNSVTNGSLWGDKRHDATGVTGIRRTLPLGLGRVNQSWKNWE
jgi:hypothetical protein